MFKAGHTGFFTRSRSSRSWSTGPCMMKQHSQCRVAYRFVGLVVATAHVPCRIPQLPTESVSPAFPFATLTMRLKAAKVPALQCPALRGSSSRAEVTRSSSVTGRETTSISFSASSAATRRVADVSAARATTSATTQRRSATSALVRVARVSLTASATARSATLKRATASRRRRSSTLRLKAPPAYLPARWKNRVRSPAQ
jgi:hypothetical protein